MYFSRIPVDCSDTLYCLDDDDLSLSGYQGSCHKNEKSLRAKKEETGRDEAGFRHLHG